MSLIFISHSSKDNPKAERLREWLVKKGHRSVFLDFHPEDGIPTGRDWEREIYRNIRRCRAVIVLCSGHSMKSRWCFTEIAYARSLFKPLFPVKIDDCDLDGVLADRQAIDLNEEPEAAFQRLWRGLLASGLDPTDPFDWDGSRPPYPGLLAFQEEDAAVFFGRKDKIAEGRKLLNGVWQHGHTGLIMVLGPTGTGKSSLVRAGLLPHLRRDVERWLVVDPFRPRDDPARELAGVLSRAFKRVGLEPPPSWRSIHERIVEELKRDSAAAGQGDGNLLVEMASELRLLGGRADAKVLLVIDQFEELLARDKSGADQFEESSGREESGASEGFLRFLRAGLEAADSPVLALGTMRSDFLSAFLGSSALRGQRQHESLFLSPMAPEHVAQIILKPAEVEAIDLERELVQALVDDAEKEGSLLKEGSLPLLAFTLRELNERIGKDGRLRVKKYREELGGLHGAVAKAADELLSAERIDEQQEQLLRKAFLDMARVSDDGSFTRQSGRWSDFDPEIHPLLEKFVQARLLVASDSDGERTLEVAHEALFRSWNRLRSWLEESFEVLRLRHEIQYRARTWDQARRSKEDLWRGGRLARARELIASGDLRLKDPAPDFVEESHSVEQAEIVAQETRRKRALRRTQILAAVVGVAFVVAAGLGVYAAFQRAEALASQERAEIEAENAKASAEQAEQALARANVEIALRLIEGRRNQESLAYLAAALRQIPDSVVAAGWVAEQLRWGSGAIPPRQIELPAGVFTAEFSSDGVEVRPYVHYLGIQVLDAATGEHVRDEPEADLPRLPFEPSTDGRLLLELDNHTVRIRDAKERHLVGKPMVHEGRVHSARFSPDSRSVVTVSEDGTVSLWSIANHAQPVVELKHQQLVSSVEFSADGFRLLTVAGRQAQVWDLTTGNVLAGPWRHDRNLVSARFSGDGRRVVTAWSADVMLTEASRGGIQIRDAATGRPIGIFLRHEQSVRSARFSSDGGQVVTASEDGSARIWDVGTGEAVSEPLQHDGPVESARFSPDGGTIITFWKSTREGRGKQATLWSVATGDPKVVLSVNAAQLMADGRNVVTASESTVQVLDSKTGQPVGEPIFQGKINGAQFSRDGGRVVIEVDDGIQILDTATGDPIFRTGRETIFGADRETPMHLSRDGSRLVTAWTVSVSDAYTVAPEGRAQVWDTATGEAVGEELHLPGQVNWAELSPDGRRLVTAWGLSPETFGAVDRGGAQVWDAETGAAIGEPLRHDYRVSTAQFSPDGRRVVTAWGTLDEWDFMSSKVVKAGRGGAQIWDAETGTAIGRPLLHEKDVYSAWFSGDGRRVVTASRDGTAKIWDVAVPPPEEAEALAHLAEVIGGYVLDDLGKPVLLELRNERLESLRGGASQSLDEESIVPLLTRWLFADQRTRGVSPLSYPEYLERLFTQDPVQGSSEKPPPPASNSGR